MKKIASCLLILFFSISTFGQNCNLSISANTATTLCAGQTTLTANNVPLGNNFYLQWYKDNAAISFANNATFSPNQAGSYKLRTVVFNPENWAWQTPKPLGDKLIKTVFVDSTTGWIIGESGRLLKTTDGGNTWLVQGSFNGARCITMVNNNTGWIAAGNIYKTVDGGTHWTTMNSPISSIKSIFFLDSNVGWVIGNSEIAKTTNGGVTWILQNSNTINSLLNIHFIDINNGWICGKNGTILKTNNDC